MELGLTQFNDAIYIVLVQYKNLIIIAKKVWVSIPIKVHKYSKYMIRYKTSLKYIGKGNASTT